MQISKNVLIVASALASLVLAQNTITFVNQDAQNRTIIFTSNPGMETPPNLEVGSYETQTATMCKGWVGNFYAINQGAEVIPGMLGEIAFNGWLDLTYFDISAIVNPKDTSGVKQLFPSLTNTPAAGCQDFPCDLAYNKWNDIMTMTSPETDFICLIGDLPTNSRRHTTTSVIAYEIDEAGDEEASAKMIHVAPRTGEVPAEQ